jgi:hypothetical protein
MKASLMKILFSFLLLFISSSLPGQPSQISIIEIYGNRKVEEKEIRSQLQINIGDSIETVVSERQEILNRLQQIPGVKKVNIDFICCDNKSGQMMIYVGVSEIDNTSFSYHPLPAAGVSLPQEIIITYNAFLESLISAIEKGNAEEDRTEGHSLMIDSASRVQQKKFLVYAKKYLPELKKVLHNAADPFQRAIAAFVIAYAPDKDMVAAELMQAIYDSNEETRNNATRGLAVLLQAGQQKPQLFKRKIPAGPFIDMINSVVWTDRNKGLAVLYPLTDIRDSLVFAALRKKALLSLFEMAAWVNPGHAFYAYFITGRIAGFSDDEIAAAFDSDEKINFLQKMIRQINDLK